MVGCSICGGSGWTETGPCPNCNAREVANYLRTEDDIGRMIEAGQKRIAALEAGNAQLRADAELGQALEGIIALRTAFDGEPPYVGNDGVILALTEALDERDKLRAELATARNDALEEVAKKSKECIGYTRHEIAEAIRALKSPEKE